MSIWIHNYSQVKTNIDLFLYNQEPSFFPTYQTSGGPIGYNPDLFTNREIINVNGQQIPITVDFSGCHVGERRFGDRGGVFCQDWSPEYPCYETFPYCNAAWLYSTVGDQLSCQGGTKIGAFGPIARYLVRNPTIPLEESTPCNLFLENPCLFDSYYSDELGYNLQPFKKIDPRIPTNGKYWNNINLWYNGSYTGNVLVENDGPSYENGGEVYLLTVGHPITMSPCFRDQTFGFFDKSTNSIIYREFVCPCSVWNPNEVTTNPDGTPAFCSNSTGEFTQDSLRLWLMKPGQEPLPNSVKKYKVLTSLIPDGFPTYGIHSNYFITKTIAKLNQYFQQYYVADRSKPYSYGLNLTSLNRIVFQEVGYQGNEAITGFGQGDDGQTYFTVTPDGETVVVGWHYNSHGTLYQHNDDTYGLPISIADLPNGGSTKITPTGSCTSPENAFIFNGDTLELNTDCVPQIFNPSSVFTDYEPNTDTDHLFLNSGSPFGEFVQNFINPALNAINKPKILTYSFPAFVESPPNIDNISETQINYPLKKAPYLSRESKNSFFTNTSNINFVKKFMLQASELNELQEKFYRNQSLFIKYVNNWFKPTNVQKSTNILGFSSLFNGEPEQNISRMIPMNNDMIEIARPELNQYIITLNPGIYFTINKSNTLVVSEFGAFESIGAPRYFNSFFYLNEPKFITVTINSTDKLIITSATLIESNIKCTNYDELKDNSSDNLITSPCGASRNYFQMKELNVIKSNTETVTVSLINENLTTIPIGSSSTLTARGVETPYLLVYGKEENGQISFYFANDVPI